MVEGPGQAARPAIIGVAGGSACGKTTVVEAILRRLGPEQVSVVQHDRYYLDRSDISTEQRADINYDHPNALDTGLLVDHLRNLAAGRAVEVPDYDFGTHTRSRITTLVEPRRAVILEGILILAEPELRELIDIKVFVDADPDLRVIRRLERDTKLRNRSLDSVVQQYLKTVRPMHLEFVEPSKRYADVIIPGGGHNEVAVDMLITKIRAILQRAQEP